MALGLAICQQYTGAIRLLVPPILGVTAFGTLFGSMDRAIQFGMHPCQKHESTKTTSLCLVRTTSGVPKYLVELVV